MVTVIRVLTEINGDDSRPVRVENLHREASEHEVGDDFEPVTVEDVQPCQYGIPSVSRQVSQIGVSRYRACSVESDEETPETYICRDVDL